MKILLLYPIIFLLFSCEGSSDSTSNGQELKGKCFQEENRKIVAVISDVEGTVVGPSVDSCEKLFTLSGGPTQPERQLKYLWPCNLSENLKVNGLEVVFSGYLYETSELEDVCAQHFEITKIDTKP